jgi:hypothetical protein
MQLDYRRPGIAVFHPSTGSILIHSDVVICYQVNARPLLIQTGADRPGSGFQNRGLQAATQQIVVLAWLGTLVKDSVSNSFMISSCGPDWNWNHDMRLVWVLPSS